jgi:preprotein translocase subunit SecE
MSIIKSEDSRKWITALVVIAAVLAGIVVTKFVVQLGSWFDLETKVSNFGFLAQALGFATGLGTFIYILKSNKTSSYLAEVYNELLKVVWPSKDATVKMTIGIGIALIVVAIIFLGVDFVFKTILDLVY